MWGEASKYIMELKDEERFSKLLYFLKETANMLVHTATTGIIRATQEEQNKRLVFCAKCPELKSAYCVKCNCAVVSKVSFKAASCPLRKW